MARTDSASINPKVLTWAIERSGISRADLAAQINVRPSVLEGWESGLAPQFNKAVEVAQALQIPFGYLFLGEPPAESLPIPDLRTLPGKTAGFLSTEFKNVLFQALAQRDWYRAYLIDSGRGRSLPYVSSFSRNSKPKEIAESIRNTLGINAELRREARTWSNYLTKLAQRAEAAGILVMRRGVVGSSRRRLDVSEFQGFAVCDEIAPMIFVNGRDYESAKIFTLVHECAHIWTGTSAISAIDETSELPASDIELLCNATAAEILVPADEFARLWRSDEGYEQIESLARHFLVSSLVIIRRARELNKIPVSTFLEFLAFARNRTKQKVVSGKGSGGDFYSTLDSRNSPTFVEALIADVRREGTLYRDAARLLSMRVPTVVKMAEAMNTT